MLGDAHKTRIANAFRKMFDLLAGDNVTHITKTGSQTSLYSMMFDWEEARAESLIIDEAGIRNENERYLLFENTYLTSKSVTIQPTDTFQIDSEIWQIANKAIIKKKIVPIAELQSFTLVTVRKAVELNKNTSGTISYTP